MEGVVETYSKDTDAKLQRQVARCFVAKSSLLTASEDVEALSVVDEVLQLGLDSDELAGLGVHRIEITESRL